MNFITSLAIHSGNPELQDRAQIIEVPIGLAISLADGAGGIAGGAIAADIFQTMVQQSAAELLNADSCATLLKKIDLQLANDREAGETTGLLAIINEGEIFGASVGDSQIWAFSENGPTELTFAQYRKPFLGTATAVPRSFLFPNTFTSLVAGTDGLWKYTNLEHIERTVRNAPSSSLAQGLCELVRLRSDAFPDDVAVATCHSFSHGHRTRAG